MIMKQIKTIKDACHALYCADMSSCRESTLQRVKSPNACEPAVYDYRVEPQVPNPGIYCRDT